MSYTFREAFLLALKGSGRSVRDIAEASGLKYERLKSLYQGKAQSPHADAAAAIAGAFGVSLTDFLEGRFDPNSPQPSSLSQFEERMLLRKLREAHPDDRREAAAFLDFRRSQRASEE